MTTKSELRLARLDALAKKAVVDANLANLNLEGNTEALLTSMYTKAVTNLGFTTAEADLLISALKSLSR